MKIFIWQTNQCHKLKALILLIYVPNLILVWVFSSPVRKYRESYCRNPGVGVGVGVAQNVKIFGESFTSLYLLKLLMDQVDTLHAGRYWSEVLCCTIMTHLGDLEVKATDLEILC